MSLYNDALLKRVLQISTEISDIEIKNDDLFETISKKLKLIAIQYNCYIISWTLAQNRSCSECYNASEYKEEIEETWELFDITSSNSEAETVVVSFKWLADKGYFIPSKKQFENEIN